MRQNIKINLFLLLSVITSLLISCDGYLDDTPKGQKTPKTWTDYDAFINYSDQLYLEIDQICILMDEYFKSNSKLNSDELTKAHATWDETVDRVLINADDRTYTRAYEGIFYWNLLVEDGMSTTECTEEQQRVLVAQGRFLRCLTYFHVTNYFAAPYSEANKDKLCVPLVTSASLEAESPQVSLETMYNFLISDLESAILDLPLTGENLFHPTKASGYGLLARVYLTMGNYEKALEAANNALALNDRLFSWLDYYNADRTRFETADNYTYTPVSTYANLEKENPENYVFRYSSMMFYGGNFGSSSYALSEERANQFEPGDTRLLTHWKQKASASLGTYYYGIYNLAPNKGGIRAAEMYYIKAECLARKGGTENINAAMEILNQVRKTRILPEYYQVQTASSTEEAVNKIMNDKRNEFIQSIVNFSDRKRLNQDPTYMRTLTRVVNGVTYSLKPDSHLWIMPFPQSVIDNPGNGTITQNTSL